MLLIPGLRLYPGISLMEFYVVVVYTFISDFDNQGTQ